MMSWLGAIRPISAIDAIDPALCATFVSTTLGLGVPVLSSLPRVHNSPHSTGVIASAGQRRGDVEIRNYLWDQAGSRSLVFDLSITHDRFGSSSHVQQNGHLTHLRTLTARCVLLRSVRSTPMGNNTLTIRTFLFSPPYSPLASRSWSKIKGGIYITSAFILHKFMVDD